MKYIYSSLTKEDTPYKHLKKEYDYEIKNLKEAEKDLMSMEINEVVKISTDSLSSLPVISELKRRYKKLNLFIIGNKYPEDLVSSAMDINIKKELNVIHKVDNITCIDCGFDDIDIEMMKVIGADCFQLERFLEKSIILKKVLENNKNTKAYIAIDVDGLESTQENERGLTFKKLNKLLDGLKNLDIVGVDFYNFKCIDPKVDKKKAQLCRIILKDLYNIKEKTLNIFNNNSRFLIYRPVQMRDEDDIGWFILRGLEKNVKEKLLLNINPDKIIDQSVNYGDTTIDVLVTSTTINDQNKKSYFSANTIIECCLFPEEKTEMMFELVN